MRGASSARRGRGGRSCGTVGSKIIISGRYPLHAEILRPVERRPGLFSLPCLLLHGCRTLLVTLFRLHRSQIFECYSYCWHGFDCARHSATCGRRRGSRMASIASLALPQLQSRSLGWKPSKKARVCPETTLTLLRRAAVSAPRTMRREFCPNADACVRGFAALGRDRAARRSQLCRTYVNASLRPVGGCPAAA